MKQIIKPSLAIFVVIILLLTYCKKKEDAPPPTTSQSSTTSITPTYVTTSTLATTTSSTSTSTATQNTALTVSGPGWTFNSCSSSPNTLTGFNGSTQVQILFGGPSIISGTYAFTSGIPTAGQARMTVSDAPGQPSGIIWYSRSSSVSVVTSTSAITATFLNIPCTQQAYTFPTVTVSGSLSCQ